MQRHTPGRRRENPIERTGRDGCGKAAVAMALRACGAITLALGGAIALMPVQAYAASLEDAQVLFRKGEYFKAARYAFAAGQERPAAKGESDAWVTASLVRAGLHQSASYFFIRTLQSGNKAAIRRVLPYTQELLVQVGADLLRKYLIRHTTYEDYDAVNRSAYLYALGKDALIGGKADRAVGYLSGMSTRSPLWPFALQLRGSAQALMGKTREALADFRSCEQRADDYARARQNTASGDRARAALEDRQGLRESEDLRARCVADQGRVLYEIGRFEDADFDYDRIPKKSFVWTDVLFEQAWNAFARQEYNRTLGKLVTYKSPALSFVFNSEVDVLRAQSFLMLCLYSDANQAINEFHAKYTKVGEDVKRFVERNDDNLAAFYGLGSEALRGPLHSRNDLYRLANRFVRGPYFQNLVASDRAIARERRQIQSLARAQDIGAGTGGGFPGFLDQVLKVRDKQITSLGGAFVKNSLMDYHSILISDFEKMAFIKLEMLSRAKDQLLNRATQDARARGNREPGRKDYQYRWGFNGEFWNDELGDYVFGLESECRS